MSARSLAAVTVALAMLVGLASGCAAAVAGSSSGIAGKAELGPLCPVQRRGETCQRAYQTTLVLYSTPSRRRLKRLRTDRHGRFHVDIAPGRYIIASAHHGYPGAREVRVTVRPHRVTRVTISFDTGIR